MARPWLSRFGRRFLSSTCTMKSLEVAAKMTAGDNLHGYTVNSVTEVPEVDLVAVELTHQKTGAQHLHLARDDSNNAFGVGFHTVPMDDTGVAHVLEHTILCGSKKYPVRDPFFKMMDRSLATFMNAYTASDWTLYPFSTQNQKDYYNLMSVYMDAVFHPHLRELDFRQEGWRLEHENPEEPTSPIIFKGVVFNEMKGVYANPGSVYSQMTQNLLTPSHTYSYVSGGDPLCILDLTWESLKRFHSLHYHPSNARFFTYGNLPLLDHLDYLDSEILPDFELSNLYTEVPLESRWTEPREHFTSGPMDTITKHSHDKCFVGASFLLSPITDSYSSLVLSTLSQLLVDGPASPFYQSLIDSNIGSEYTPNTGYDNSTKESSFSVGLQGVKPNDVDAVKGIIMDTLSNVSREGFAETRVHSILHQIELGLRHQTSMFGISLMTTLISPWIHGASPTDFLLMSQNIERLKKETQDSNFWTDCIHHYFLNNNHRLTLVMSLSEEYMANRLRKENFRRIKTLSMFSDSEKINVYEKGLQLIRDQDNSLGQKDCLPSLHLSDVNKYTQPSCLQHDFTDGVHMQYSVQPTNHLTYFRALIGIDPLPDELKIYIPLFSSAFTQFGTDSFDYREFSQLCDQYTGGLNVSTHVRPHCNDLLTIDQGILFSSYCLDSRLSFMLNLWEELFRSSSLFEEKRLRTIINIAANAAAMEVSSCGHLFAIRSASNGLTPSASVSEILTGLTQVHFLKQLSEQEDLCDITHKLTHIAGEVLKCRALRCAINTSSKSLSTVQKAMEGFVQSLPGKYADMSNVHKMKEFVELQPELKFHLNAPVNYVSYAVKTVPYNHNDSPSLEVLSKLMTAKYLHKEIREKGGAYGAGIIFSDGIYSFYSFRDPNSISTLNSFRECIQWCSQGEFTDDDITHAKMSVFAQLDYPIAAGSKGLITFLNHLTSEMQQCYREKLFGVSKQDLLDVTARYMLKDAQFGTAIIG